MADCSKELLRSVARNPVLYFLGYVFLEGDVIGGLLKLVGVKEESLRELPPGEAISQLGGPNTEHVRLAGQFDQALFFGVDRLQGLVALCAAMVRSYMLGPEVCESAYVGEADQGEEGVRDAVLAFGFGPEELRIALDT